MPRSSPPRQDAPDLRQRVVIENVHPEVDEGRYPAKATVGIPVRIEADIYADNHEEIAADILLPDGGRISMQALGNDRWQGQVAWGDTGLHTCAIEAWIDHFERWRRELEARILAGAASEADLDAGHALLDAAASRAGSNDADALRDAARRLADAGEPSTWLAVASEPDVQSLARANADKGAAARYHRDIKVLVESRRAEFSSWYEMFPRSASPDPARPGTLADVEARLDYVAGMGFDVLYLPPIHPIGSTNRKGANGSTSAGTRDPGSPWAIGTEAGGHKAVNPDLGTMDDFRRLVQAARGKGIEIALDIALQCSPDHPYVSEHPDWFRKRPDGTIQHAENPPKKYEDIYPFDFETEARESLWEEVRDIFLFWMDAGVRTFRVDNPHTKPFSFWEWCIQEVKRVDPDVVLLAEAFTRPKIMYKLAKVGFSQSYTYFAWRNDKWGLTDYFRELTSPPVSAFYRPNAWPSTPDILTEPLQTGGRPMFIARLVLAATLSASYGIYGPPFELLEHVPREPGSEEYLNSEKYEVRHWDLGVKRSIKDVITKVNRARQQNPAFQTNSTLQFHDIDNDQLILYSKRDPVGENIVLCAVNLDPAGVQSGTTSLPTQAWGIAEDELFHVNDLLTGECYAWEGPRNFIRLDPNVMPAHIFRIERGR
jgi:starch synthase (maltosyl-transferring)